MLPSFGDSAADSADPRVTDTQDIIYQSPLNDFTDSLTNEDYYDERYFDDRSQKEVDPYKMPVFKQMRIKLTNKYRQITSDDKPKSQTTFVSRLKIRDKKTAQNASPDDIEKGITDTSSQSDLWNTIDNTANIETSDSVLLDGGVQEEEVEKQLLLDASRINFDDESGDMVATGRPILFLPPQNTKIIADKMMYNDDGNILKAIGNVIVIKDGKPIHSDYLEIDMNEELLTSNNIFTEFPKMNFKAESGQQRDGLVVLNNGSMYSDNSYIYKLTSRTVGATMNEMILDKDSENLFFGEGATISEGFDLTLHPFCRNATASMDWGGIIMNKFMSTDNKSRHSRKTTDIFELASGITMQTSVQCVAMQPNNLQELPQFEMDFLRELPTTWEETRFIDGYPGKYVVMARKATNGKWYIAGLNAQKEPLALTLDLKAFGDLTKLLVDDKQMQPVQTALKKDKKGKIKVVIQPNGGMIIK